MRDDAHTVLTKYNIVDKHIQTPPADRHERCTLPRAPGAQKNCERMQTGFYDFLRFIYFAARGSGAIACLRLFCFLCFMIK
jgi:hypothetical protein